MTTRVGGPTSLPIAQAAFRPALSTGREEDLVQVWRCMGGCGAQLAARGYCAACSPPDGEEATHSLARELAERTRRAPAPPGDDPGVTCSWEYLDFGLMAAMKRRARQGRSTIYDESLEADAAAERAARARAATRQQ